ncbi:unnamed protein product [Mytilus edulis]|uniref:Reverse transcriptase domain-containing protein n=1 Tax=Mytilus edulis TaxID=6550 RepID=A0A8S3V818_MYTED|nr:unnamed protein product [Mytilus edulis]
MIKCTDLPTLECKNNFSARSQPLSVRELINKECEKGFLSGPYKIPPFNYYRVSPLGLAVGKYSGKKRLILDLSAPHDDDDNCSINDLISKEDCSMTYVRIDDAIKVIRKLGRFSLCSKFDIEAAFKQLGIRKDQWHLFCIKWCKEYFFFNRLAFGCRSSPIIFDNLSRAICWIATNIYKIEYIFHLLDDFLTIDKPDSCAERTMALMTTLFKRLNIPLAKHKVVGPCTVIEYLGIILDTEKMETRLPLDKTSRISEFIKKFLNRQSCTKRELLQLLGHLNFAMRVIIPGRSFVSYLISLSTTVKDLKDKIYLTDECRTDLRFWYSFLVNWNGINMFYDSDYTSVRDIELYTDAASTIGYGGYFKGKWFCSPWPDDLNSPCEKKFSMAFLELYPIVVAAILWGHSWTTKRILFRCDNEATVHIVNKGRSRCLLIMKLMRTLTLYASRAVQDTCTFSGHSTSQVPASLTSNVALKSTVSDLWRHVLSTRTSQTYKVGYRAYTAFLANNGVVWLVSKHFDSTVNLSVTDVEILDSYAILHLKTSKTDPFRKGVSIQLHKSDHTICPFSAVQKYIAIRKGREASFCFSDPLFVKENGNALDRDFFIRSLRHVLDICGYNSSLYNGHSFRIGASTSAGSVNIQDHLIKTLGRWTSDSYCRYIRISNDTIRKAQKSLTLSKNT